MCSLPSGIDLVSMTFLRSLGAKGKTSSTESPRLKTSSSGTMLRCRSSCSSLISRSASTRMPEPGWRGSSLTRLKATLSPGPRPYSAAAGEGVSTVPTNTTPPVPSPTFCPSL
eukprot:COSAG04_NODE_2065_length_4871_cov_291.889005_4_plen_113_part_00